MTSKNAKAVDGTPVDASGIADGQVLVYDAGNAKFVVKNPPGPKVTDIKTGPSTYVAIIGELVLFNPSGGGFQIDGPTAPTAGDVFSIKNVTTSVVSATIDKGATAAAIEDPFTSTLVASYSTGALGSLLSTNYVFDGTNYVIV